MLQNASRPNIIQSTHVSIVGAGIAGAWQALVFARAGFGVTVIERDSPAMTEGTSHVAGGMLAPDCEAEASEPAITRLGRRSLQLWREAFPDQSFNGSLVVAHPRDRADFARFAALTQNHERADRARITALEPALDGRFTEALFFADEGHVEPRVVLAELHARIAKAGGTIKFGSKADPEDIDSERSNGVVIDCRGLGARKTDKALRGVKGEMIVVETDEISLSRPVRVLHPRWPLYVIPRNHNRFMIGATSIESEDDGVSVRSALELLSAAYALHPAFGEARIVEFNAGLRPAYPDNLPRIDINGRRISVNGLYRHGFLLAPALAELTLNYVQRGAIDNEVMQCA